MMKLCFLTFISSLREGPTRPSRPRLRNENPPPPIEKHFALQPVSTNTVPVGLSKALANGNGSSNGHSSNASTPREGEEQRTRRVVRSYLSSREIFEPAILAGETFSHPSAGAASASV
ncbi:hypothetical protein EDB85DRAFT_2040839 [Lactarius pseudohatsudake]|nr:hypothetical protein EDB85DRAFT_2040839 [Lactarius pseudohatsudake]